MVIRTTTWLAFLALCFQSATAQDIPLTIDSSQSTVEIAVSGASDSSSLSGSASIELVPSSEPFSTAQVKTLNLVLDDGFTLTIFGGLITASSEPGSTSLEMTMAGDPGTVNGLNEFDQFMNEAEFAGVVSVVDPLNLAGGSRDIDLSTYEPAGFDMLGIQLSVDGNTLTVSADIALMVPLDDNITLDVTGVLVSTGELPVPDIQVVPDSLDVIRGILASGTVADLADSDNVDVSVRRDPTSIQSVTDVELKGVSSIATPARLEFTLDASVFARTEVIQTISLYDYDSDAWEQVDSRPANRFSDLVTSVTPAGDITRFVQPGTGCVEAKIVFQSTSPRQQFSANIDQTIWTIGQ